MNEHWGYHMYQAIHHKRDFSGLPNHEMTEGTRKLEKVFTKQTIDIQTDPKLPTESLANGAGT